MRLRIFAIALFFVQGILSSSALGHENTYMITYGKNAGTIEGDDDFVQVIFVRIPEDMGDSFYIRIFDADCGGRLDAQYSEKWDTRTRFRLFGGKGAYSNAGLREPSPVKSDLLSGVLIADEEFGEDPFRDNQWYSFARVSPENGEKIGAFRYFKLVVEGKNGDDGNTFLVAASSDPQRNLSPADLEIFTFAPTIRLPRTGVFSEMRFFVPEDVREITVHNFDLFGAIIGVDTRFRENLPVRWSGQDEWMQSAVSLDENEVGNMCAIRFQGGREMPNDGTFFVTDDHGKLLPIRLPIYLQKPNSCPKPHVDISQLADCKSLLFDGSRTVDPEGDSLTFHWDFGDGTKGEGVRITHRYQSPGRYQASVIVENASGLVNNSAFERFTANVNYPPKADAGPDLIGAPGEELVFNGSGASDPDGKVVSYYWDFGDGHKARGVEVRHDFKQPDFYTVTLRVEDSSESPCNFATDRCQVFINAGPVVEIGDNRIASMHEQLRFSGVNSSDSDGKIISYDWDLGDGTLDSGITVTHAYEKPGIYEVTLRISDGSGVKNSIALDRLAVFVNDPPVAHAGSGHRASAGESILFDGSGSFDRDGKIIEYLWDLGDGAKQQGAKVTHSYESPGEYRAVLTIRDNSGSSSDTDQDNTLVLINYPPIAEAGPDQHVTSSQVEFDGTGSYDRDGKVIGYLWDFGDGSRGTVPLPVHVYQSPGIYVVRLTVTDDSNTSTNRTSDEMMVRLNHLPIADAGPDIVGVPGQKLILDGSASVDPDGEITRFEWDFGDGTTDTGVKVSHRYAKAGKYNVLLTLWDNSGHEAAVSFDEAMIVVNQLPVAVAGPDLIVAPDDSILFDGSRSYDPDGKIVSYHWDFGDREASGNSAKVRRTFTAPGVYTATLTVVDNSRVENSTAQDKVLVRVNHRPEADAGKNIHTNERTVLLDGSASTDADGDPLIYTWDFGDKTPTERGEKVFHTYALAGNYPVILSVDDQTGLDNARSTSSIQVKINAPPIADAGENKDVCAGEIVIFDGGASIDPEGGLMKYHWDFGDGTSAQGVNPTKIYTDGGVYPVTLTVVDDSGLQGGNTSTDQIVVKVAESVVADAGPDQIACAGTVVQFDGTGSRDVDGLVNHFQWDFADGALGGGPTPIHVYTKASTYRVGLTITGDRVGDCDNTDEDEMIVTVYEGPVAELSCPATAAKGESVLFDASKSAGSGANIIHFDWSFGDATYGEGETCEHRFAKSGKYIVTLTVTTDSETDCNKTSIRQQVTINEPPVAKAGDDSLVGVNQVITFDGSLSRDPDGIISSYTWDFGDGQTGNGVQVRHQYQTPSRYEVVLQVIDDTDLPNNSATDTLLITVNEAPKPVIMASDAACAGERVLLSAKGSTDPDGEIAHYSWNFGDGMSGEGKEVYHTYGSPGSYVVELEVDDGTSVSNSRAQTSTIIVVNAPPVARAGSFRIVSPAEEVLFDGSASVDRDGSIISFKWDFGDGSHAEGPRTTHRFKIPGEYQVRLAVTDNSGTRCNLAEDDVTIRVNSPPVAVASGNREGFVGGAHDAIFFDATGSHDPDGDPLTFYWDFGDGGSAHGSKVTHGFKEPGQYTVRLRVDDGTGLKSGVCWDEMKVQVHEHK